MFWRQITTVKSFTVQVGGQGDQIFSKNSPKSCQVKKGQNIYNKAQFENPKHLHQTTFETLKYLQQTMF
jgi:hypothetical protein